LPFAPSVKAGPASTGLALETDLGFSDTPAPTHVHVLLSMHSRLRASVGTQLKVIKRLIVHNSHQTQFIKVSETWICIASDFEEFEQLAAVPHCAVISAIPRSLAEFAGAASTA
jgi:hypothetical protein